MVLLDDIVSPGVNVNWEYPATALEAGLMLMEPRSPPRAVNALPIATVRAVPSLLFSLKRRASYAFWAYPYTHRRAVSIVIAVFFITKLLYGLLYLLPPPELLLL
jgi:hypothetical protein